MKILPLILLCSVGCPDVELDTGDSISQVDPDTDTDVDSDTEADSDTQGVAADGCWGTMVWGSSKWGNCSN